MNDVKSILQSTTIWSAAIAVAASTLSIFHIDFSSADQAAAVQDIYAIVTAVGGLGAIYGRIRATAKLTVTGAPK